MDISGEGALPVDQNGGEQPANLNISDVIDAITRADPLFGAGPMSVDAMPRPLAPPPGQPYVRIVEQPAGKALRFRYECEGRSAGSIPGANSTPERKTYPTIEICGHKGQAIIVVSCVTREAPYKPHPHNLVGREKCDAGVCTVKTTITEDNPQVSFSNLGIQCVKRKDIADALKTRERLRVDPFKTGFNHRNQPQSIDLNAVRLCFQVFIHDERTNRVRLSLPPVVSDIIYDKKAMSDLVIMRISHCSGFAKGDTEVILLCEKVTREDIAVVFFQKEGEHVVWEAQANVVMVHRQFAVVFQTPPYRNPHEQAHVQVYLQLKRNSDNARSNAIPFEYVPNHQGTARKPLPDLSVLSLLLADTQHQLNAARGPDGNNNTDKPTDELVTSTSDTPDVAHDIAPIDSDADVMVVDTNEKSLDDLLDQVAELDEIYSENRTRLENITTINEPETDLEDFNDAGTYTSLQLAFKNPVQINEPESLPYEDVQVQTYRGPIIEFTPLKRDTEDDRAPPLPPKRVRKTTDPFKTSQTSVDSVLKPGKQLPITRNSKNETNLTVAKSEPALPPAPKKRSFFSRLFRRKDKSPAPSIQSEGKEIATKPVGRSVSSVSGIRPSKFKSSVSHTSLKDNASGTGLSYADSVTHISLHGDGDEKSISQTSLKRPASLAPIPPTDGDTEYLKHKRQKTLSSSLLTYEERGAYGSEHIKSEPRDKTPPHQSSPRSVFSPTYEVEQVREPYQQWPQMPALSMDGPSYMNYTELSWGPNYTTLPQLSPGMQSVSPNRTTMANLQPMNYMPNTLQPIQSMSPTMVSPMGQVMSPVGQVMSPVGQVMSPVGQVMSPVGGISPLTHGAMSPNMGHVSPAMGHISPNLVQHMPHQDLMETAAASDTPSLTGLLMERGEGIQFNSGDLTGLSSLLDVRGPDLTDSLNRLSTSDLLH